MVAISPLKTLKEYIETSEGWSELTFNVVGNFSLSGTNLTNGCIVVMFHKTSTQVAFTGLSTNQQADLRVGIADASNTYKNLVYGGTQSYIFNPALIRDGNLAESFFSSSLLIRGSSLYRAIIVPAGYDLRFRMGSITPFSSVTIGYKIIPFNKKVSAFFMGTLGSNITYLAANIPTNPFIQSINLTPGYLFFDLISRFNSQPAIVKAHKITITKSNPTEPLVYNFNIASISGDTGGGVYRGLTTSDLVPYDLTNIRIDQHVESPMQEFYAAVWHAPFGLSPSFDLY